MLSFTTEEQAESLTVSVYDPLSGLVEKVILPIDADGDGAVSDTEVLNYLAETSGNAQRMQAIAQWQASGVALPQPPATRAGMVKAAGRPEPPSPEANDLPFDCRSNPHGRDASESEPTRSGVRAASYCSYDELMNRLEACWMNHWDVCRPVFIGESVQGRRIMGVRIGRVNDDDGAAELLIAGGIHGNERPGVEVALRFAEWLLDKLSGTDENSSRVRSLMDSTALFVIPSMNPDGMVAASTASANTTAWNNARENANGIDLNRSYPDGVINTGLGLYGEGAGLCLDESLTFAQSGMQWHASLVPETVAFMKWCCSRRLAATIMLHTGAATVCYPYGNNEKGRAVESVCPDDALLKYLAKGYVAHSTLTGMTTINSAAWYPVVGEAPDWMYRYLGVLPLTVEISTTKEPSATRLDTVFAQQRPALLWWMEAASHGVGGRVLDASGESIAWARVSSDDEAPVFTDSNGRFFRTIKGAEKSMTIRSAGFEERSVDLASNHRVELELQPLANAIRMAGRVSRGRFLPNYLENVSIAVQGSNDGAQECIVRLEAEAAQLATIGGTSEYWRWNADGSASVLFEHGVAMVQNIMMTLTQFDRPYSDHRLRLGCRTVSEVTQMVFPWVSATRRTFVVNMPAKAAFALPAFLEQPSITQGCFRWSGGRFSEAADGVLPLFGYWNSGENGLSWTESGWEPPEWRWKLAEGWNFISVPWRMPAKAFGPVMLHGSPALTFVTELVPGRAYWVYSSQETIIR